MFFAYLKIELSLLTVGAMHIAVDLPARRPRSSPSRLVRFERSQEEAALDLGASQLQMMTKVVLPQLAPALAAVADLRVRLVVQQLRDQLLQRRLRADLPGLGLLGPAPLGQPAGRQRDLDAHLGDPGRRGLPAVAAASAGVGKRRGSGGRT